MSSSILNRWAQHLLQLPRAVKRLVVVLLDTGLCVLTVWLAFCLSLNELVRYDPQSAWLVGEGWATVVAVVFAIPIFIMGGLYRSVFRYSGWASFVTILRAMAVYGLFYFMIFTVKGRPSVPRSVGIFQPILLFLFIGGSRWLAQNWLGNQYRKIINSITQSKVLVYGAGRAGRQLVAAMSTSHEMRVLGFLDDDPHLQGRVLNGLSIYAPIELPKLVERLNIDGVLLAMPSISPRRRSQVLAELRKAQVQVRTLPSVTDLAQGKVTLSDLRDLDIHDLLGREQVVPDQALLTKNIAGQVVMVTGAGGSIGSELCRQILAIGPAKLLMLELSEFALYVIHEELDAMLAGRQTMLVPLLGSVQDESRMRGIMTTLQPSTVYHAAAYKHVPLVEHNPAEGIKNNVWGTLRLAQVAAACGVSDFVLISTDKAVRPTNIMGASKRLAEIALQALAANQSSIRFSMVRFGNVLGSSGSVVPKFRQQIRDGGPITLTHPDITRYFMTIPEASQLVIQAGAMARGGDVFVLDMGQPVKILDLAHRMIQLSGLTVRDETNPDGDIGVEITGLRPGEKLYEELLIGNQPQPTAHSRIFKAHEEFLPWEVLEGKLSTLETALVCNDVERIRNILQELVTGYAPNDTIVDWIHMEHAAGVETLT